MSHIHLSDTFSVGAASESIVNVATDSDRCRQGVLTCKCGSLFAIILTAFASSIEQHRLDRRKQSSVSVSTAYTSCIVKEQKPESP